MPQIEVTTARGTRLTARRNDDSIIWLYRGRELACLPLDGLLKRKEKGLHLSRDEDPRFWVDPETLTLAMTVLGAS